MRKVSTFCFIFAITAIVACAADNSIGTWKLNAGKSKYTPGPLRIKSLTITREASDGGVKVRTTGERPDGTAINTSYTAKYDGKDVPVTGTTLLYDTIAVKQVNANTFTDQRKNTGGKYHATGNTVISNSGKTMTSTSKGINAEGKDFTQTLVFEKE